MVEIGELTNRWRLRSCLAAATVLACTVGVGALGASPAAASQLPFGFTDTIVFSGLTQPTTVQFSPDGRVFVAEKSGIIKVYDSLSDPTPTVFADLSTQVYNYWDRGLLGLALDPNFPANPYIYVHYARDALVGGSAPRYGTPGVLSDPCPTPPGPLTDGCVVSGRLSRLQANGNVMTGTEKVLIDDWCQQYPSHSVGAIAFGADGALYTSGGDGASWTFADWGQAGVPTNPCGDPPSGSGTALSPPTAEGGALRSQDIRTTSDPAGLDGTIIRVNPATGAALPDNPGAFSSDANVRRVIAYGLRNPFRLTVKPGTNEIYTGDVGWDTWEEVNVATPSTVTNFGWPCYEGPERQSAYDAADLNLCETLYGQAGAVTAPLVAYQHSVTDDACSPGSSSISGLAFYGTGSYPSRYNGALFYADYSRNCMWALIGGVASGKESFGTGLSHPVDLKTGPGGDLFYVDFDAGTVHRIAYTAGGGGSPTTFLSDLTPSSQANGWGPFERDQSNGEQAANDGQTLTLNGTTYAKGLGVHATSDLSYTVPTGCTTFTAAVGVDDEVGVSGDVIFRVYVNGSLQYDSGAMGGSSPTKTLSVAVTGGSTLRLLVDPDGILDFDHADWADAKLACGSGGGGGNQAPQVTTPAAQNNTVGQAVSLQVVGSDPDAGQTLTWTASGLPGGLSINASSGLISGTVASGAQTASPYTATVTATDNGTPQQATSKQFTWTITTSGGGGSSTTFLSDLTPSSQANGWGPFEHDQSNGEQAANDGQTLTLNGTTYAKGLGVHATSDLSYTVPTGCTTFTAAVGVDDEVGANGDVIFRVYVNGSLQYDSGAMTGPAATKTLSVAVTGGSTLRLLVDPDGSPDFDHADWADAKLACGSGGGGNTPPQPQITTPTTATTWKVGDTISFSGSATDTQDGALPASALSWSLIINHCPSTCHTHDVQTFAGVASGSFVAPDHDYPSTLELRLTATDSNGTSSTTSVVLNPKTVALSFASSPSGLSLAVGSSASTTPFTRTLIVGSQTTIIAPTPQALGGQNYSFQSWSDAGAASHTITAPASPATFTATYTAGGGGSPTTFLSDLTPSSQANGWGPFERDQSNGEQAANDGQTLTLNGTTYAKGLGVHATSDLSYTVPTGCTTFTAAVGVDDEVGVSGDVIFRVYVNGSLQYDSGAMGGSSPTKTLSVAVTGGSTLRLLVDPDGILDFDHADWADAKLACGSGGGGGNQAPQVTTPAAQNNTVGQAVSLQVVGSDPDAGQTLTWTASGLPGGLSINASSGLISGTVASGAQTASPYTATVTATDNGTPQQATSKQFTWTITTSGGGGSSTTFLSDLTPSSQANGWGPFEHDQSNGEQAANDGQTLTLNGTTYAKGLGVHATSDLSYTVPTGCTTFTAAVGVDDEVGANGDVIFRVYVNGSLQYDSGAMTGPAATKTLSVAVTGGSTLRLLVDPDGSPDFDHADWADAKLAC